MAKARTAKNTGFLPTGTFSVGCNYWASHAGTAMWSDWRADVVKQDLHKLSRAGLQVLRVFPLWPDFQPLTLLRGGGGTPMEYRFGETPLPDDAFGRAGVAELAMERFAEFADIAQDNGLKLIVGLVTGWMSGRLFVPPALEGRNPITDPVSIQWQVRMVQCFVHCFKNHPAVAAWDLGNECNCMGSSTREQAWTWTASIVNAIRANDATRLVVSGMHGMRMGPGDTWTIQDQAELTDLLTTHPYPYFTPHCDQDPIVTMRPSLHSTAESCYYGDIGHKPCLVEEIGTLGPMFGSEPVAAAFIRTALFSSWAHDLRGLLWWCGFEQLHLENAPYDWNTVERELGLFRLDGTPKPVLDSLGAFRKFIDGLPFPALPPRLTDAVCLLSQDQDHWGVAYSTFLLAKQAGFDIRFADATAPLPDSPLYLLPSLRGGRISPRRRLLPLLERVANGATLYISHDDAIIPEIERLTGLHVVGRERRVGNAALTFSLPGAESALRVDTSAPVRLRFERTRAEVLGTEADGEPAFTVATFGKGRVFFLACPVERDLLGRPGAFHGPAATAFWQVYRFLFNQVPTRRAVTKDLPCVGVTEHPFDARRRAVVVINYSPAAQTAQLTLAKGWQIDKSLHGVKPSATRGAFTLALPANNAAVLIIAKSA
ncbi:MAG: hypothetical protein A3K19_24790 [Lentisphaerae bacterium RIFOXYB12_FULL_65_16]|nr:MAG: hypothetical protein A3K18_24205 [Lentisphaerae bacterium RIFOXYA12_64_32]OGV90689.1 MAG: hypothetical protein A3K19_24790 [Lentisphaerae bacterium RIFOXYB12_FULL_65_16]